MVHTTKAPYPRQGFPSTEPPQTSHPMVLQKDPVGDIIQSSSVEVYVSGHFGQEEGLAARMVGAGATPCRLRINVGGPSASGAISASNSPLLLGSGGGPRKRRWRKRAMAHPKAVGRKRW